MNVGAAAESVIVYSRPGCIYCMLLRRKLRRMSVSYTEVNIWRDPAAAAAVRAAANGNETVPTVVVGGTWLVNPAAAQVLELMQGPR